MKKLLLILLFLFPFVSITMAQADNDDDKIRDKMRQYIQQRMRLTKNEAERFTPERKEAFDQWYEDEKACEDWSLHTKLREYCRSDVIVLGEACCIMTL